MSRTEKRKTSQKQAISDALIRMDCHPTATMIADELQEKGQKASRATVFRVLSDAAEEGKIRKVQLCGEDVRYDCNTKPHYHLHCLRCGKIEDYTLPYMLELDNMISDTGFMIKSHNIEFLGICRECRQILAEK